MYDLFVPIVPANHLSYLGVTPATMNPRSAALDLGLMRALVGCLLAIGATALVLVHGPIRRGERWAMLALVMLVGVSEGINASQVIRFGSPYYAPLTFVGLMVVGVGLVSGLRCGRATVEQTRRGLAGRSGTKPTGTPG
jgi:hypothetical protein